MMKQSVLAVFIFLLFAGKVFSQESPDALYGDLFREVQMGQVFEDSKTFADCIPKEAPAEIMKAYAQQKLLPDFQLKEFVLAHFYLPPLYAGEYRSDTSGSVTEHVESLWTILTREPDTISNSSLIPLPHSYVVPGGRFREIYYWDSYFTMLGLGHSGKTEMMQHMTDNFSYLIDRYGFIPNGNRTYYLSRSQPPFYSLMVELLVSGQGENLLQKYLPYLEKEYRFWMSGTDSLCKYDQYRRVVKVGKGTVLNRYWDDHPAPRPESYREDVTLAAATTRDPQDLYRNLRAACESGWDFSSRWLRDPQKLATIHTIDIIPVDLNCLLLNLENLLSKAYCKAGNKMKMKYYATQAKKRKAAILTYCWDKQAGFFSDYDFRAGKPTGVKSLAAAYPLFFHISTRRQASLVKEEIMNHFLKEGGLVTTLTRTSQQWDAPNGWAPLQWITVKGFINYGYSPEALSVARKWLRLNTTVFKKTGKMLEKYNVCDPDVESGGGEYPLQDGFGWTNGVFLKLKEYVK